VTVTGSGEIVDISSPPHLDREAGVEFFPGIMVPGFLNAHCHLELSHLCGSIAPGGGFTAFARGMREVRDGFSDARKRSAAEFWDAGMWSEGVSVVGDICNGSSTFALKSRSRIKYRNFCELFGLGAESERRRRIFELCDHALDMGLSATVTPHSTYSLNLDGFVAAVGDEKNKPLSIHFMESEQEVDLFRRRGAMWEWYSEQGLKPDFLDHGGPAERLVAQVPKDRPVMLVHNCVVTQRDIDIVMGHFTAPVTWVVCPGSNRYISGLTPPVDLLRKNRLKIAVGTDSLASNDTLSMVRELSLIKNVPLAELLGWAAADTIETGHTPGLVVLTGVDFEKMALTDSTKAQRII
jgi:cytosine/adenosine deaminase-related metal-dependent hydrolase